MTAPSLQTYTVTTHQGDTLDEVMHRHGCTHSIEQVLLLNPQLIPLPCVLPYHLSIRLPYNLTDQRAEVKTRKTLNLWS